MKTGKMKIVISVALLLALSITATRLIPQVQSAFNRGYEQIRILVDIIGIIKQNYVEEVDTKKLVYGAASGMVRTLDPFSQFMEPDTHKEMKIETEGEFGGLGIRIAIKNNWLTVITPIPGTPAYRIGIMPEDMIVEIEGESTKDITLNDAVKKLRGKPRTKVTIKVARKDENEPVAFTITRELIKIESVISKMIDENIGYIHLLEFSKNSAVDMKKVLKDMKKRGMNGLVLDMRNNPGGLLRVAVDVCNEFLGDGKLIVYTQARDPKDRKDYLASGKGTCLEMPMVVLVNRGSASGSEIVAGAIQDHKRGLIIGAETFGKASVQSVIPLSDESALRLTTARYYTPAGRSIHRNKKTGKGGIAPDIAIEVDRKVEVKLRVQNELIYSKDNNPSSKVKKEEMVNDVVLDRAKEVLKAMMFSLDQKMPLKGEVVEGAEAGLNKQQKKK